MSPRDNITKTKSLNEYHKEILHLKNELAKSDLFHEYILKSEVLKLTNGSYSQIVCVGLRSLTEDNDSHRSIESRYQLALILLMAEYGNIPIEKISLWNPRYARLDVRIFKKIGVHGVKQAAFPYDREADPRLQAHNTIFFLPHSTTEVLNDFVGLCEEKSCCCLIGTNLHDPARRPSPEALKHFRNIHNAMKKGSWVVDSLPKKFRKSREREIRTPTQMAFCCFAIERAIPKKKLTREIAKQIAN